MKISLFIGQIDSLVKSRGPFRTIYVSIINNIREIRIGFVPLAALSYKYWQKYIYWCKSYNNRYLWFRLFWFGIGSRINDEI